MSRAELIRLRKHPGAAYPFSLVYYQGQTETGRPKRHRLFFKNEEDAEAEQRKRKNKLKGEGIVHDEITEVERHAIIYARTEFGRLSPRSDGAAHSIVEAIAEYCTRFRRNEKSATVKQYVASFLEHQTKLGKSPRTLSDLKSRLERFAEDFGDRTVRSINKGDIQKWILGLPVGPKTKGNYRKLLSWLFSAAVDDGFADTNFARRVEVPTAITKRESLTPAEMLSLLTAAPESIRAAIVLAGFCGLRESEVSRVTWEKNISLELGLIEITTDITKTAQHRHVEIPPNALAWLQTITNNKGGVVPVNARRIETRARRAVGFGRPGSETPAEKAAGVKLRPWPSNALRHSAATYRLLSTQNPNATALWLGNSAEILNANYRSLVLPATAEEWWNIYPPSAAPTETGNVIDFQPDAA